MNIVNQSILILCSCKICFLRQRDHCRWWSKFIFWDGTLCSLVDKCQLHLQEDVGSRFLSNISTYIQNYMASHPMKL